MDWTVQYSCFLKGRLVWADPSAALEANLDLIILWSLVTCDLGPEGQPCGLNDDTFAMAADIDEEGQVWRHHVDTIS